MELCSHSFVTILNVQSTDGSMLSGMTVLQKETHHQHNADFLLAPCGPPDDSGGGLSPPSALTTDTWRAV